MKARKIHSELRVKADEQARRVIVLLEMTGGRQYHTMKFRLSEEVPLGNGDNMIMPHVVLSPIH